MSSLNLSKIRLSVIQSSISSSNSPSSASRSAYEPSRSTCFKESPILEEVCFWGYPW